MEQKFCYKRLFGFIGIILITLVFYGGYLKQHYSPDAYDVISRNQFEVFSPSMTWDNFSVPNLKMGRFGFAVLLYVFNLAGINPIFTSIFSNFIAMIFFSIAFFFTVDVIRKIFLKNTNEVILSIIILIPLFMNPLYCDWFQYSEVVVYFSFSFMIGTILSLKICFQEDISLKRKVMQWIVFFFCLSIHQTILNLFLIYSSLWLLLIYFNKEKINFQKKIYIKKWIEVLFLYATMGVVQFIMVLYYGDGARVSGSILENLLIVVQSQPTLWLMKSTGKANILLILTVFMGMMGNAIVEKRCGNLFIILGFFCFLLSVMFSTHIVAEPWLSQRTTVFLYSIPSVFGLLFYLRIKKNYSKFSMFFISFIVLIVFLNITYMIRCNNLAIFTHQNNAIDRQVALQICNQITEYEKETGVEVTKISFKNDPTLTYVNPEIFASYDMNIRAFSVLWSRSAIIEINLNRMLEEVDMPSQVYDTYFKNKDWNIFEEEQVKIIGDTVYIMVY